MNVNAKLPQRPQDWLGLEHEMRRFADTQDIIESEPDMRFPSFAAGFYYIGDPIYLGRPSKDDDFPFAHLKKKGEPHTTEYRGLPLFLAYTAEGDGSFGTNEPDTTFGVDSGTFSCVPLVVFYDGLREVYEIDDAIDDEMIFDMQFLENEFNSSGMGMIRKFEEPFVPKLENGTFHFGGLAIHTAARIEPCG